MDLDIQYSKISREDLTDELLQECAALFNAHYGRWSDSFEKKALAGKQIALSPNRIKSYFSGNDAWIGLARLEGKMLAYAIVSRIKLPHGYVSWVTQLVVHSDYQNRLIGSVLLDSVWVRSQDYAWGIASANPYAVRALEKATRRRCEPKYIGKRYRSVDRIAKSIPYLNGCKILRSTSRSVVDTKFFQDLSSVGERIRRASEKRPWLMGHIQEGQEWLAITFQRQRQIRLTDHEFEKFMRQSDIIVGKAYERMAEAHPERNHPWARPENAEAEIGYLIDAMGLKKGQRILDFGCGAGRHALALAQRGYLVVGVDFSPTAIAQASKAKPAGAEVRFLEGDCRTLKLNEEFDAGICLYDVIGSYPDLRSNQDILRNLATHLKPGAPVAMSVMSYEYIEQIAKRKVASKFIQDSLLKLPASNTMESSGDIFDPDLVLLDTTEHVVYRKETFTLGARLPEELIVRDRRFTIPQVEELLGSAGFEVKLCGHVRAGKFQLAEQRQDPSKEILAVARKSLV